MLRFSFRFFPGSIKSLAEGVSPIGRTDDDSDGDGLPDCRKKNMDNLDDLNGNVQAQDLDQELATLTETD